MQNISNKVHYKAQEVCVTRDVVVIGGGPGGSVAAMTAKKHYRDANVMLVKREGKTLVPCSIPYIFKTIGDLNKNLFTTKPRVQEPNTFAKRMVL